MLYLSTRLSNIPLLSIRTAGRIGTVLEPIINPHSLHIDGFYCQAPHTAKRLILLDIFVREISPHGVIINEHNDLSEPEELVRLQPILKLQFNLVGKQVLCDKKRLGKVSEYAIDKEGLFIQKLYVQPPVWQSLNQNRLTIDRRSILEVTTTYIKVSGPEEKINVLEKKIVKAPILANDYSASASLIKE
jgi:hypothetical protein